MIFFIVIRSSMDTLAIKNTLEHHSLNMAKPERREIRYRPFLKECSIKTDMLLLMPLIGFTIQDCCGLWKRIPGRASMSIEKFTLTISWNEQNSMIK